VAEVSKSPISAVIGNRADRPASWTVAVLSLSAGSEICYFLPDGMVSRRSITSPASPCSWSIKTPSGDRQQIVSLHTWVQVDTVVMCAV